MMPAAAADRGLSRTVRASIETTSVCWNASSMQPRSTLLEKLALVLEADPVEFFRHNS